MSNQLPAPIELEDDTLALDKTTRWRYEQMKLAGFDGLQSFHLARERDVDLHEACDLAEKAGPEWAFNYLT